ncbi:TPA: hypothetical protein ACNUZK_004534 [Citrobacter braakii]|nr:MULTISPECIES: hypothetical protein [Citrobacter]MBS6005230.1 hypothetical protein [Citrobacter sp.]MEB0939154.1 hypothetical protein [Citrobacter braakii]MEB0944365.1 hypothetical protein [Citrobacter braakii]MEB0969172.1 hypothetical protein [Citrobacter braakii]MEB0993570.1 hypothetical protein [Citrobacter braakii]
MHTLGKYRLDSFLCVFILLLYPLFIRDQLIGTGIKLQYLLNFIFIIISVYGLIKFKVTITKSGRTLLLFVMWMVVVLFIGFLTNFQADNTSLEVPAFFAINPDGELAESYFNQGDIYINAMYIGRMIVFIPLSFILGCSMKKIEPMVLKRIIWIFMIISFIFVSYDYLVKGMSRSNGLYDNPQDMSAIILFYTALFLCITKDKKSILLLCTTAFFIIIMTGTRSSLLVLCILILLKNKPKLLLVISLLVTVFVSLVVPSYLSAIHNIEITSMSSTIVRLKLWGDYLIPRIAENMLLGVGTVPVVTENLLLFLLFVFGSIGTFIFTLFLYRLWKYSRYSNGIILILSVIICQSVYFMGLLSLDNIVVTFFVLGFISKFSNQNNIYAQMSAPVKIR